MIIKETQAILLFLFFSLSLIACGEEGEQSDAGANGADAGLAAECGGHGSLHGEHCHCEEGYAPAEASCVAIEALGICEAHEHEAEEHHYACRCDPIEQQCSCPEGGESHEHQGNYYCLPPLH